VGRTVRKREFRIRLRTVIEGISKRLRTVKVCMDVEKVRSALSEIDRR
jgi:hypothetical protein